MIAIFLFITFFNIYLVPYLLIDYIEIFTLNYLITFINFINKCKNKKKFININILPDDLYDNTSNLDDKTNIVNNSIFYNIDLFNLFDTFNKNLLFYTMIEKIVLINNDDNSNDDNSNDDNSNDDNSNDDEYNADNDDNSNKYTADDENISDSEKTESDNEEYIEHNNKIIELDDESYNDLKEHILILDNNEDTYQTDTNSDIIIVENID